MSNLPVSSRLKTPASRIAKPPGAAKAEGIPASRIAVKPPSFETPQKLSGLRQPLAKRNSGEVDKTTEKRSSVSAVGLITPRSKSGSLTKLNKTGLARPSQFTPVGKRENLKSQSSVSSTGSLKKETEQPVLTREKTQESLKDVETGILFKVGDRVLVGDSKAGVIEYLGETKFAKGYWAGIKLDEPSGKNDGCVAGVRYFDCEPLHGVFSKSNRLHKINIFPNKKASISEFKLEDSNVLKIGDPVLVSGSKLGILRYLGPTEFAKGEWAGVELEEAFGKNDGAVAGTRYFSCEMKHGLFAPSSKVVKSKRHSLSKKSSVVLIPETSLANAAKSVFNKTTSLSSETSESHIAEVASPSEKPSAVAANVSGSPIEALHQALKKTPSNAQHVAALQSALEEREREIRKMLMEKELEKAEKLQGLDETTKNGDSTSPKQDLQDKDDIIQSLKDNLETYKKDSSVIQTKLDEEKKKYEDLQFMLEEEKITDDELKNHVKEDESKIKELSDETKEKNELIHSLQRDLQEARAGNLNNEAKVLQLHDKLNESEIRFTHATNNAQENTVKHETLLTNTQKELEQSREDVRQKCEQINELENKVNEQMKQQKGIEEQGEKELKEKLSAAELETKSAFEECERLKYEKDQIVEELTKLQNERNEMLLNLTSTTEKLQTVERQYKDLLDANTMLTKEKDRAIKANSLSLNAQILDLESQLSQSYTQVSQLEDTMATNSDVAEQKKRELQTLLANATRELSEQKEEVNKKTSLVDEMERKLNAQLTRQKEIEKEVESLDQADKSLALMQEAHRAEVEALQSKVNSLTEIITEMTNKQGYVVERHNSEMAMFATSKEEEMKKFKEKIHAVEIEKSTTHKECENLRMEKEKVLEEFSRLQNENNDVLLSKNAISEKRQELEKKYNDLSEANVKLSSERDYTIQMCEKQNQRLDILKKEKESLVLQKDLLAKEKVFLESNLSNLHSESTKGQGELIENKESEIRSLNAELEEALKDKQIINDTVTALKEEKNTLESDLVAKADDVFRLQSEQHKMHSLSQEFQNEVSDLKKKILEDAKRSRQKIETLSNEIAILKDDLDEGKILLKRKEEGIRTYKEQIERMGSDGVPKSPMDGDILENASTLLIRLHEAESKLSVLQSEKESVEEQVEFLNSVIVELQNKNLKANKAMLEARDESILLHGLDSESDDEVSAKPKYTMRIFCDICDVFDKHETDECPLQESSDDTSGVKNNGDRNYERPYCNICEAFGHWTEDCDDEETY